jgi:hypothetical protein
MCKSILKVLELMTSKDDTLKLIKQCLYLEDTNNSSSLLIHLQVPNLCGKVLKHNP